MNLLDKVIENEMKLINSNNNTIKNKLINTFYIYKSYNKKTIYNFKKEYKEYLQSTNWKKLRERVLKRDNYLCVICNNKANHVHHLSYGCYARYGKSRRIECVSLCKKCHMRIHKK